MIGQKPAAAHQGDDGFLRLRLDVSYDGGPFSGWAVQPGRRTVQGALEEALALLLRRPVRVTVAGRTDAGVHASGQVVHLDLSDSEWRALARGHALDPSLALLRRLHGALGRVLGDLVGAVEVTAVQPAPAGFDARFSALWRRYSYRIADPGCRRDPLRRHVTLWYKHPLDVARMNAAATPLLGLQDFRAYAKPRQGATTVRELQRLEFAQDGEGVITATAQADAFCHNMVRALVGAALRVGEGREGPQWMHERLLAKERDARSLLAPAHPLVLEEVCYPPPDQLLRRAELTRARRDVP